jgi:hypothetical protein
MIAQPLDSGLSPMARRVSRSLLPLALLATLSVGAAVSVFSLLHEPAQLRLARAEAAYAAGRQIQPKQEAARKTQEDLQAVWAVLPERRQFPRLVLKISELAQWHQVAIPGMTHTVQTVENGLALKATMTFQAAGQYADIRRFIHRLETMGPYLLIESLDVARVAGSHPARRVMFNVQVGTFLRPDTPATKGST